MHNSHTFKIRKSLKLNKVAKVRFGYQLLGFRVGHLHLKNVIYFTLELLKDIQHCKNVVEPSGDFNQYF